MPAIDAVLVLALRLGTTVLEIVLLVIRVAYRVSWPRHADRERASG